MDRPLTPKRLALPWGLLGMLAMVLAIESAVARDHRRFESLASSYFEFTSRAAKRESADCDLLCFGDSVLKFGIIPRLIEERTGLKTYNLATVGTPAPMAVIMLRKALESGAKPRGVFVDFKPALQVDYRPDLPALARIVDFRDGIELAWTARDSNFFGEFAIQWSLPSYRDRLTIRSRILESIQSREDPEQPVTAARKRNWWVNRGAQVLPPNPLSSSTPEFYNEKGNLRPDWSCHPVNSAYITRFFRLARAHGIPVYWVITPVHPRLQAGRERLGIDETLTRFVRSKIEGENVVVLDARRLGLDGDLFVDATHFDRRGAVALSAGISEFLMGTESRIVKERWVILPRRTRPVDDPRLEDTNQTALAMGREIESRRR